MRKVLTGIAGGLLLGIIIGILAGLYLTTYSAHPSPYSDFHQQIQSFSPQIQNPCMVSGNITSVNMSLVERAIDFMNSELVRPGVQVSLINASLYNECFYRIMVNITEGNRTIARDDVYLTLDGKVLAFNVVELTRVEMERVNVSAGGNPVWGNPDAEVEIIVFSDYSDPLTSDFELKVLPKVFEKYGDRVKYVFRDYPVTNAGAKASLAANCARAEGKFWKYHRILVERQSEWVKNTSLLYDYAEELGINRSWFVECVENETFVDDIIRDSQDGFAAGVSGTPTVFINGIKIVGVQNFETIDSIIERVIRH